VGGEYRKVYGYCRLLAGPRTLFEGSLLQPPAAQGQTINAINTVLLSHIQPSLVSVVPDLCLLQVMPDSVSRCFLSLAGEAVLRNEPNLS
jgi:hypothetical protein